MGLYDGWRKDGFPTLYGPLKTPVTADVLEAGFLFATAILAFSLFLALPGVRGLQRLYTFIRILIGVFVLASTMLVNYGQSWEVAEVTTHTQYRAGLRQEIKAHVGVHIGLRSVNVTLKGDPEVQAFEHNKINETINYNERFSWNNEGFALGRAGFGPFAGRFNQEFRAGQRKGLPYPILWVAEYFTIDGEGIRWGRHYLQAGYYTHIMVWMTFPLWILSMMLFTMVLRYGGYFTLMTGGSFLLANILWATIRNPNKLAIPFEDGWLNFSWGWTFWLCLANGLLCVVIGLVVIVLDYRWPEKLTTFFGVDIATYYEEFYVDPAELQVMAQGGKKRKGTIAGLFSRNKSETYMPHPSNGATAHTPAPTAGPSSAAQDASDASDTSDYENAPSQQMRMYRKKTILGPKPRKPPVPVPRTSGDDLYENTQARTDSRGQKKVFENPAFDDTS